MIARWRLRLRLQRCEEHALVQFLEPRRASVEAPSLFNGLARIV